MLRRGKQVRRSGEPPGFPGAKNLRAVASSIRCEVRGAHSGRDDGQCIRDEARRLGDPSPGSQVQRSSNLLLARQQSRIQGRRPGRPGVAEPCGRQGSQEQNDRHEGKIRERARSRNEHGLASRQSRGRHEVHISAEIAMRSARSQSQSHRPKAKLERQGDEQQHSPTDQERGKRVADLVHQHGDESENRHDQLGSKRAAGQAQFSNRAPCRHEEDQVHDDRDPAHAGQAPPAAGRSRQDRLGDKVAAESAITRRD